MICPMCDERMKLGINGPIIYWTCEGCGEVENEMDALRGERWLFRGKFVSLEEIKRTKKLEAFE